MMTIQACPECGYRGLKNCEKAMDCKCGGLMEIVAREEKRVT